MSTTEINEIEVGSDAVDALLPHVISEDVRFASDGETGTEVEYPSAGFMKCIANWQGMKYGTYVAPGNHDPWVKEALKSFDRSIYDKVKPYTRRPGGIAGMYRSLAEFDRENKSYAGLSALEKRAYRYAYGQAKKAFTLPEKVRRLSLLDEVQDWLEPSTSAGYTFYGKKKGEVLDEIMEEAHKLHHTIKIQMNDRTFNPRRVRFPVCLAAQRGGMVRQEEERKTRLVWIYPAEVLALEAMYAKPIYDAMAAWDDSPMLYGRNNDRIVNAWSTKCRAWSEEGGRFYGTDMTGFDQHVPRFMIKDAFNIISHNFSDQRYVDERYQTRGPTRRGLPVAEYERRLRTNDFRALEWYFTNTSILMPDGKVWRKYQGVPSGTAFTQIVDSIVNYMFIQFTAFMQGTVIKGLRVLGDDSGFYSEKYDMKTAAEHLKSAFGAVLKWDKSIISIYMSGMKLLGFTYNGMKRVRSDEEWFKLALCPEGFVPNLPLSFGRLYGLFLAGAKHSTLFCRFMNYFQSGYPIPPKVTVPHETRRWLTRVLGIILPDTWHLASVERLKIE